MMTVSDHPLRQVHAVERNRHDHQGQQQRYSAIDQQRNRVNQIGESPQLRAQEEQERETPQDGTRETQQQNMDALAAALGQAAAPG